MKSKKVNKKNIKSKSSKKISIKKTMRSLIPSKKDIEERKAIRRVEDAKRGLCDCFTQTWIKSMCYLNLYNAKDETYYFTHLQRQDYGFTCYIHNYMGGTLTQLLEDEWIRKVEQNTRSIFIPEYEKRKHRIKAVFITEDTPYEDFKPIKLAPYKLLCGMSVDLKHAVADMCAMPHIKIEGATSMGKTKCIDTALVNLTVTESPKDVELYFIQLDKSDQVIYRRLPHCKAWIQLASEKYDSLEEVTAILGMLKFLYNETYHRENKILLPLREKGLCENISDYNKAIEKGLIKGEKWCYRYLVIDEFASLMPNGNKTDLDKIKSVIQDVIDKLIQLARGTGLYLILSVQRATIDKMPSFLKAMSNTNVVFRVSNRKSSEVALDNDKATYLEPREFIIKSDKGKLTYGKTMNLTPQIIDGYLDPMRINKESFYDKDKYIKLADVSSFLDNDKGKRQSNSGRKSKEERRVEAKAKWKEEQKVKKSEETIGNICSEDFIRHIESMINKEKKQEIKKLEDDKQQEIIENKPKSKENDEKSLNNSKKMLEKPKKEVIESNLDKKTTKNSPFLMTAEEFARFSNVKVIKDETNKNGMRASELDNISKREEIDKQ